MTQGHFSSRWDAEVRKACTTTIGEAMIAVQHLSGGFYMMLWGKELD